MNKCINITWKCVHPLIREMLWIMNKNIQDIGFVSRGGNFMVNSKAIEEAYQLIRNNNVDYNIQELLEVMEFMDKYIYKK